MRGKRRQELAWMVVAAGAAAVAGASVNRATEAGWRFATGQNPPDTLAEPRNWGRILSWVAVTAGAAAIASLFAEEAAALGWRKATGKKPPLRKAR